MKSSSETNPPKPRRPLFDRFPALIGKLPFLPIGEFPTPVARLAKLGNEIGVDQLWVKCDDVSALDYGGNKIRKLEFLLADALERGCNTVVTFGGLGSNHALATSINCRRLGLQCVVVLTPEPATEAVLRTLRYHHKLGTIIRVAQRYADTRKIADELIDECGASNVYEVPFGGSSWIGATGFVNAALELEQQVAHKELAAPDVIYLGCGTAGSTSGLALGLQIAGLLTKIQAIQVTPESVRPDKLYRQLYTETAHELHSRGAPISLSDLSESAALVRNDQLGAGYAEPTDAGMEAARLMLNTESLNSSLTYTAKTMAALIADARAGLLDGKRVLFWNTYNSRPYPELKNDDSWRQLPRELHYLFSS